MSTRREGDGREIQTLSWRLAGVPLELHTPSDRVARLIAAYFHSYNLRSGTLAGEAPSPSPLRIDLFPVPCVPQLDDLIPHGAEMVAQEGVVSLWQNASSNGAEWLFLTEGAALKVDVVARTLIGWIGQRAWLLPQILVNTTILLPLLLLLRQCGRYHLHSGAILSPSGERWLICGAQRSGKSTLTTALGLAGWHPIADDGLFIFEKEGGISLQPLRKSFHLDQRLWESWPALEAAPTGPSSLERRLVDGLTFFGTEELAARGWDGVDAILFPRISGELESHLTPVNPSQALLTLVRESIYFPLSPPHPEAHWSLLTKIVRGARGYALSAGLDLLADPCLISRLLPEPFLPDSPQLHRLA
jgi:hypothetical protein